MEATMRILIPAILLASTLAVNPYNPYDDIARDGARERDQIMRDAEQDRQADQRAYEDRVARRIEDMRRTNEPANPRVETYGRYDWSK
jgi:hypothetical protein